MKEDKSDELYKLEMMLKTIKGSVKKSEEYRDLILTKKERNENENIEFGVIITTIDDDIRHYNSEIRQLARDINALKEGEENDTSIKDRELIKQNILNGFIEYESEREKQIIEDVFRNKVTYLYSNGAISNIIGKHHSIQIIGVYPDGTYSSRIY